MEPDELESMIMGSVVDDVSRKQSALESLKEKYMSNPNVRNPTFAAGDAVFGHPGMDGTSSFSWGPALSAARQQKMYNFQNELMPDMLELESKHRDPMLELYKKVRDKIDTSHKDYQIVQQSDIGVWRVSRVPGKPSQLMVPSALVLKQMQKESENIYNHLVEKAGYPADAATKQRADALAKQSVEQRVTDKGFDWMFDPTKAEANDGLIPTITSPNPVTGKPVRSNEPGIPSEPSMKKALVGDFLPGREPIQNPDGSASFGKPVHQPMEELANDPRIVNKTVVGSNTAGDFSRSPLEAERIKTRSAELEKDNVASARSIADENKSYVQLNQAIPPMEGILLSGKNTSGPLHETLTKVGGYLNMIDPSNSLAEAAGNDAAYFGKAMDLVRDKIKALGAGTAVSNLDLITTQKSIGDLRNTPQGNMKILGLMKLFNASMERLNQEKLDHFNQGGDMLAYKRASNEPYYAVRAKRNPYGEGNHIYSYELQSKEDWVKEQIARNKGKEIPQELLDREWVKFANGSVSAMFKE